MEATKEVIFTRPHKTVYATEDKIIKVFDNRYTKADVLNEARNEALVELNTDLNVPSLVSVNETPEGWCLVRDKVEGKTLQELMDAEPEKLETYMEMFVDLQLEVHSQKVPTIKRLRHKLMDQINSLKDLYTGGATLACAAAGATVCHVDASKGIVAWGKDNAVASGMADRPIRWLVDDCAKFVAREKRRGNTYDGIIMDPPSYGRGPGGEIWKLEDCIYDLISQCEEVLSDKPLFFAVNSYTTGLSPAVMEYMLKTTLVPRFGGKTSCDEIGLPVSATGGVVPCGATAIWEE